jgi:hypothetical protein
MALRAEAMPASNVVIAASLPSYFGGSRSMPLDWAKHRQIRVKRNDETQRGTWLGRFEYDVHTAGGNTAERSRARSGGSRGRLTELRSLRRH